MSTSKKKPISSKLKIRDLLLILAFALIAVMAYELYATRMSRQNMYESLAEQGFKQQLMINQLQTCVDNDVRPCGFDEYNTEK